MMAEAAAVGVGQELLGSILYRSRAIRPPSAAELQDIVRSAQERNRSMGVTGMLLYENGRFLQTIEGPPLELDEVWASIRRDKRHAEIEVLSEHLTPARLFNGWHMQLFDRERQKRPATGTQEGTAARLAAEVQNFARHALAPDSDAIANGLKQLVAGGFQTDDLVQGLLEPVARFLGDAWLADDCSDLDLSIALATLRSGSLKLHANHKPVRLADHSILLTTAPQEPHMLGTSLLADLFLEAGWQTQMEFPADPAEVLQLLLASMPDAIDIALSDAMLRPDRIDALRDLIGKCREAMTGRHLVVSVGGRAFAEGGFTADMVGADHARISAVGTVARLTRLVERHHSLWPGEQRWNSLAKQ